jgi:hypothetical protein
MPIGGVYFYLFGGIGGAGDVVKGTCVQAVHRVEICSEGDVVLGVWRRQDACSNDNVKRLC